MPDSPLQVEDWITPHLQRMAREMPQVAAEAALSAATTAAQQLRRRIPRSKNVLSSDRVSGWEQPVDWITVQPDRDGAEIIIRTFYGDLTNSQLRSALVMSGQQSRFARPALEIHLKAPGKAKGAQRLQSFSSAPRLQQWAQSHYQYERRSILVDKAEALAPFLAPVDAAARHSIFRDLFNKLGG